MTTRKPTKKAAKMQAQNDALQKPLLQQIEQALLSGLQLQKTFYGTSPYFTASRLLDAEKQLRQFHAREDVQRILYPPVKTHAVADTAKNEATIHLICIGETDGSPWPDHWTNCPVFLDRYTTPGKTLDCNGEPAYPINEFDGELWSVEDFIVSKPPVKN